MTARSHLQIHFTEFGSDTRFPMAFPEDVTLEDLTKRATTMVQEGKAREAAVINTSSGATLWSAQWALDINPNSASA